MHYDIFRRLTRLQTVLLHSIHCKYEFRVLPFVTAELNACHITFPSIILEKMTTFYQVRCITIYFHVLDGYERFCSIRYTASTNSAYYSILPLQTHTNDVSHNITLNYTSMTNAVLIYQGTVAFYRELTRITVSDIKSEWI